jgi:DNA-directed RNA polymerase III subunit RPC1
MNLRERISFLFQNCRSCWSVDVPQTEEARTEALELMSVKKNLVTPRNGEPIIAAIQDFITASYLLSRRDRFYDRQQFTQICSYLADGSLKIDLPPPTIWKPVRLWTGKQIFNVLMRLNKQSKTLVNLEAKCRTQVEPRKEDRFPPDMSPNDGYLVIQNSEIMCGVFDKNTVGDGKKNSVFGVILRDYGAEEAASAMNRLAKLAARWLTNQGFSLGINDVIPGPILQSSKDDMVEQSYEKCDDYIELAKRGLLENAAGCDQETTLEQKISGELSGVRGAVGQTCMKELSRHNAPLIMATSGSKGISISVPPGMHTNSMGRFGDQCRSNGRLRWSTDHFGESYTERLPRSLPPAFPKEEQEPALEGFRAQQLLLRPHSYRISVSRYQRTRRSRGYRRQNRRDRLHGTSAHEGSGGPFDALRFERPELSRRGCAVSVWR